MIRGKGENGTNAEEAIECLRDALHEACALQLLMEVHAFVTGPLQNTSLSVSHTDSLTIGGCSR